MLLSGAVCVCLTQRSISLHPSPCCSWGAVGWTVRQGLLFRPSGIAEMLQWLFLLRRGWILRLCSATVPGVANWLMSLLCQHCPCVLLEKPLSTSSDGWHRPSRQERASLGHHRAPARPEGFRSSPGSGGDQIPLNFQVVWVQKALLRLAAGPLAPCLCAGGSLLGRGFPRSNGHISAVLSLFVPWEGERSRGDTSSGTCGSGRDACWLPSAAVEEWEQMT